MLFRSMWAKPTLDHGIDNESTAGTEGNDGQRYAIWPIHASDAYGAGHSGAGISIGTNGVSVYEQSSGYNPALLVHEEVLDDWNHITVVYDNKTPSLYLNGVLARTGLASFKTVHPSAGKGDVLGSQSGGFGGGTFGGSTGYYGGWLDEIRYYDRALSTEEIVGSMNQILDHENVSGLIGYWRFDEGSGLTAIDLSSSENHASIIGPDWSDELPDQIPPEIPTGLEVAVGDHEVNITWTANTEADLSGYEIHRSAAGFPSALLYTVGKSDTEYLDLTAENGIIYQYSILAYDLSGNKSSLSVPVEAQPINVPPVTPLSLSLNSGDGEVTLSWDQNDEWDIDGYAIYQDVVAGFSAGTGNQVVYVSHPDTIKTISGLTNGETYYFLVAARDTSGLESGPTVEIIGEPLDIAPSTPLGFGGTGFEEQINLTWVPNNEWDLSGYNLYRSTTSGFSPSNSTLIANLGISDSTYADETILTGTLYFYVFLLVLA